MRIKLNRDFSFHKKGTIVDLSKVGIDEMTFFTRRIKESSIDNCVTVLSESKKKKSKKSSK